MIQQKEYTEVGKKKKRSGFSELISQLNKLIVPSFLLDSSFKSHEIEAEHNSHSQIFDSSSLLSISDLKGNIILDYLFCIIGIK